MYIINLSSFHDNETINLHNMRRIHNNALRPKILHTVLLQVPNAVASNIFYFWQ